MRPSPSHLPVFAAALLLSWATLGARPAEGVKRRAFATSVSGTGDLGSWAEAGSATGVGAGDAICRNLAGVAGLPNSGTYRAWLSTAETDAYCHVQGLTGQKDACIGGPGQAAGPWYLANGISNFTAALPELTNAPWEIYRPVLFDEHLDFLPGDDSRSYWTGTHQNGQSGLPEWTCDGWTSGSAADEGMVGDGLESAKFWSASGAISSCSTPRRLLCLEPGVSEETRLGWTAGSIVFLSTAAGSGDLATWPEAGGESGLAAGDAICRNLAAAAHLPSPEAFVAWLSASTADAADRVTTNGPFRRIDGYAIANNKVDLLDGMTSNSLHVHEDGTYLSGAPFGVSTGTLTDGTAGAENCADWTSAAGTGIAGQPSAARLPDWTDWSGLSCSTPRRLYCFSNRTTLFWDGFELTGDPGRWSSAVP